jgi:GT2 family glycosyltransferase
VRTAVITTAHGRHGHLQRQLRGLRNGTRRADLHVVVAIDDPGAAAIAAHASAHVVEYDTGTGALPIAAARNAGARVALERDADLLVFLDVDCIPSTRLIDHYVAAADHVEHRDALLCGPVTYLPPPGPGGYPGDLEPLVDPHPARPAPPDGDVVDGSDYTLFWSLSFALSALTWQRIGGFHAEYEGYGAEDTDFAQTAWAAGVPLRWVGGADAFHQHHPVSNPPVEHVDDILRNAAIYHRRWGSWPMPGWLAAFEEMGLIQRAPDGRPSRRDA